MVLHTQHCNNSISRCTRLRELRQIACSRETINKKITIQSQVWEVHILNIYIYTSGHVFEILALLQYTHVAVDRLNNSKCLLVVQLIIKTALRQIVQ